MLDPIRQAQVRQRGDSRLVLLVPNRPAQFTNRRFEPLNPSLKLE